VRGSMREKRPGYWELRVSEGRHALSGKSLYHTKGFKGTKREAERALAQLVVDVDRGKVDTSGDTVEKLLDRWLVHIEHEGRSPTTMRGYRSLKRQLPKGFLHTSLRKLTPALLDDLYRELAEKPGRGPTSIRRVHAMLRTACNQAMRWEMLDRNPAQLASPPRVPASEIEPPPIDDVLTVIKAAESSNNPENAVVFRLIGATGCRRSEACGLRWSDVDLTTGKVRIRHAVVQVPGELHQKDTKSHQQRTVTLDKSSIKILKEHKKATDERARAFEAKLGPNAFVFSSEIDGSQPIPPDRLSQAWRRLADIEGVESRLHDLRHLQASVLLDAGESITTVAARLGHRDTATTLRVYAHLMPGADQRAADIVGDMFGD